MFIVLRWTILFCVSTGWNPSSSQPDSFLQRSTYPSLEVGSINLPLKDDQKTCALKDTEKVHVGCLHVCGAAAHTYRTAGLVPLAHIWTRSPGLQPQYSRLLLLPSFTAAARSIRHLWIFLLSASFGLEMSPPK